MLEVDLSIDLRDVDVVNRRHGVAWVNISDLRDVSRRAEVDVVDWLPRVHLVDLVAASRDTALRNEATQSSRVVVGVLAAMLQVDGLTVLGLLATHVVVLELDTVGWWHLASRVGEGFLLHEHVHPVDPLVVFLQALRLLLGERKLLVLQVEQSLQVVAVSLQLLIGLLQVLGESVLNGQVPLQSAHLSVEVVQLILLRPFSLSLHVESLLETVDLAVFGLEVPLELLNPLLQHPPVGVVSRLQVVRSLSMVLHDVRLLGQLDLSLLDVVLSRLL